MRSEWRCGRPAGGERAPVGERPRLRNLTEASARSSRRSWTPRRRRTPPRSLASSERSGDGLRGERKRGPPTAACGYGAGLGDAIAEARSSILAADFQSGLAPLVI